MVPDRSRPAATTPTGAPAADAGPGAHDGRWLGWFLVLTAVVTGVRLWVVAVTPLQLGPDEAQYWAWGRTFEWGYFSKPPLVGWLGGLAPLVGGDSAAGVRWPSALLHAAGTLGIVAFTHRLAGQRAGVLAGLLYLMAPGVWLSSLLLATDAIMIPLVIWGLYGVQRLRESPGTVWAVAAGALFGLAALGKYAALYVPGAIVLGCLVDRPLRRALWGWPGLALAAALLAVLAPNLAWNAASGGATIRHTVGNAGLAGGPSFDLAEPLAWLGEQFGVFGLLAWPLGLSVAVWALVRTGHPMRPYAFTVIVPVLVVALVAAASRANANWAAVALAGLTPAAGIALAGALDRPVPGALARAGLGLALAVQTVVAGLACAVFVNPALGDRIGATAALSDVRGWPQTSAALVSRARDLGVTGIVADNRNLYHGIHFSGRHALRTADDPLPRRAGETRLDLRTWRGWAGALNHAEGVGGLAAGTHGRWLLASERPGYVRFFREDFETVTPAGSIVIPLGPGRERRLQLFVVSGVRPVTRSREDLARP